MAIPNLKAELREGGGKGFAKKLRSDGFIPGVVYGHNKETRSIKIKKKEIERHISRYGRSKSLNVSLNGEIVPVIIKDLQRDLLKEMILHIDLQQLSENEKIKLSVPINLLGKDKVESSTTLLQQQLMNLDIQCLPKDIPDSITADVSELKPGEGLEVSNLDIYSNEKVEVLNEPGEIVALIISANKEEIIEEDDTPIYESDKSILDN